jgi:adhesin transport system outer membrane protein
MNITKITGEKEMIGTYKARMVYKNLLSSILRVGTALSLFASFMPHAFALNLEDAVRSALQNHPSIASSIENHRYNEYNVKRIEGQFLPTVSSTASGGYQIHDNGVSTFNNPDSVSKGSSYNLSLQVDQTVYDGGSVKAQLKKSEAQLDSSFHDINASVSTVAISAMQVYLQVLQERELSSLAEENVKRHQEILRLVEKQVQGGSATLSDVQTALFRLAATQNTLTQAQSRLRDARAIYKGAIGELPLSMVRPLVPREKLPRNLQAAIQLALQNDPALAKSRSAIEAARHEIDVSKAATNPKLTVQGTTSVSKNQGDDNGALQKDLSGLVTLSYNLYDGGQSKNLIRQNIAYLAATRQDYNLAARQTEEQVRRGWASLIAARENVASNQRENKAYRAVRDIYQQQFESGTRTVLDVFQSESQLYSSEVNLITAVYNEMFSSYNLLGLTGLLLPSLNISTPDQPAFFDMNQPAGGVMFQNTPSLPGYQGATVGSIYANPPSQNLPKSNPYEFLKQTPNRGNDTNNNAAPQPQGNIPEQQSLMGLPEDVPGDDVISSSAGINYNAQQRLLQQRANSQAYIENLQRNEAQRSEALARAEYNNIAGGNNAQNLGAGRVNSLSSLQPLQADNIVANMDSDNGILNGLDGENNLDRDVFEGEFDSAFNADSENMAALEGGDNNSMSTDTDSETIYMEDETPIAELDGLQPIAPLGANVNDPSLGQLTNVIGDNPLSTIGQANLNLDVPILNLDNNLRTASLVRGLSPKTKSIYDVQDPIPSIFGDE